MDNKKEQYDILRTLEQEMDTDMHPLLKKILENIKLIGLSVGVIVIGVAVYSWLSVHQADQKDRAVSQLGKIIVIDSPVERISQLNSLLATAPENSRPAMRLELVKSYLELKDYEQAGHVWETLNVAALADLQPVARLGVAKSLLFAGKYVEAATELRALKAVASDEFLSIVANTLAFAEEHAGNTQAALAEYEAIKVKESANTAFIDYKINKLRQKNAS